MVKYIQLSIHFKVHLLVPFRAANVCDHQDKESYILYMAACPVKIPQSEEGCIDEALQL